MFLSIDYLIPSDQYESNSHMTYDLLYGYLPAVYDKIASNDSSWQDAGWTLSSTPSAEHADASLELKQEAKDWCQNSAKKQCAEAKTFAEHWLRLLLFETLDG